MLFNSFVFIFAFLPVTTAVFFLLSRQAGRRPALAWLAFMSLVYYGWWKWAYLGLMMAAMAVTWSVGCALVRSRAGWRRESLLWAGVIGNLAFLGYFKYAGFFVMNTNTLLGSHWAVPQIVLPIGISFYTFTQIAFLVDAYRGEAKEYDFVEYCLFISFFPQLIAGPILHHKEMMPQFNRSEFRFDERLAAVGLAIFAFGLVKKTVIADGVAPFVAPAFEAAAKGLDVGWVEAWAAALAYAHQIYFDFSGYSDMAVGLSLLFGVRMPLNFHSPYKAANIIEFWRRWHMTLSRFLRDYLYIPLGGNRRGEARRYLNLIVTMLLGGLWHGANWTFVVWGGLHGAYLAVNHVWRQLRGDSKPGGLGLWASRTATFAAVVVAWVYFRAPNITTANRLVLAMLGGRGLTLPESLRGSLGALSTFGATFGPLPHYGGTAHLLWVSLLTVLVWASPNVHQWFWAENPICDYAPQLDEDKPRRGWSLTRAWALAAGAALTLGIAHLGQISPYLYFQF